METLIINQTDETPYVILNSEEGRFQFSGKSYPENVNDFYSDIINYLALYVKNPQKKTLLEFNWVYFSTGTSKIIVTIITLLKTVTVNNKFLEIKWYCKMHDDLMLGKGEELNEVLDANFSIVYV